MDSRGVLEHRLATLDSLLEGPPPVTGGSAEVGRGLRERWAAERRLLVKLMAESKGLDVADTAALWRDRTERFIESSGGRVDGWVDTSGTRWNAELVLGLLDELQERLDQWNGPPATDLKDAPPGESSVPKEGQG